MVKKEDKKEKMKPIIWQFHEYTRHKRSGRWYFGAGTVAVIIIIYSLAISNFVFALIAIMIGMLMVINHYNTPEEIEIEVSHQGIRIGNKEYPYTNMKEFWIIYQPPEVKTLYITFKSPFRPQLSVPLEKTNPVDLRAFLRQYLEEDLDQENEPFSDALGRILKI